ncbi:MAG: DUF4434 domain-containing protein [Candidatus Electrothrix communis]|nr:MAG: DUF4434 domain-containing protein [Candidatus Electrothrix communis]
MTKRLSGGYIQLWPNNGLASHNVWSPVLAEMNELGMDTAIIQFMDTADSIKLDESLSIAKIIFTYAQQYDIKVFLGLYGPPEGEVGSYGSVTPQKLSISLSESVRVATVLEEKFRDEQKFYGWHLPLESWTGDYNQTTITNLNSYYKELTAAVKGLLPDKKVLISPFINAENAGRISPERTRVVYTEILQDTGIDFLALQDGVGAGHISVDDPDLPVYFAEMCAACTVNDIEMWVNIESFKRDEQEPKWTAADSTRFLNQLDLSQGGSRIVTFDFFHYMNTGYILGETGGTARPHGYGRAVRKLNRKYKEWLAARETTLTDGPCR